MVRTILIMFESASGDMAHGKVHWHSLVREVKTEDARCFDRSAISDKAVTDLASKTTLFAGALWCQQEHYTACLQ